MPSTFLRKGFDKDTFSEEFVTVIVGDEERVGNVSNDETTIQFKYQGEWYCAKWDKKDPTTVELPQGG